MFSTINDKVIRVELGTFVRCLPKINILLIALENTDTDVIVLLNAKLTIFQFKHCNNNKSIQDRIYIVKKLLSHMLGY